MRASADKKNVDRPDCHKIDLDHWERREHYRYYTEQLRIEFSLTASLDVTAFLNRCHERNVRFYPSLIYCAAKVLNEMENFKMFRDKNGDLCCWETIHPNYTIFHEDDHTFSDCWTGYSPDFSTFYKEICADMERFKDVKGIKARPGQPVNFFCISCVPWVSFSGYSSRTANGEPNFFPVLTAGKYQQSGSETRMPLNLTIAHAVCDGYHAGMFFERLQQLDGFSADESDLAVQ
ncbi:MAG: chloramphenicol acetyltransferase [Lachnospiraceae bacterium]|nr:chloramphenicol acetyltransferase [Lachnospiraceae bacterium]